jgi:hypothetical protein
MLSVKRNIIPRLVGIRLMLTLSPLVDDNRESFSTGAVLWIVPGDWRPTENFNRERAMFVIYFDESGIGDETLEPYLVVAAVLIDGDSHWRKIEAGTKAIIERCVPKAEQEGFEFKADAIFGGRKQFANWDEADRLDAQASFLCLIADCSLPVAWAAISRSYVRTSMEQNFAPGFTAAQVDLLAYDYAFVACAAAIEAWFSNHAAGSMGISIADQNKKPRLKWRLKTSLQQLRAARLVPSLPHTQFEHFMDTISFNDSKESIGLQMADHCAYFVKRRLMKKQDSDRCFEIIKPTLIDSYLIGLKI